MASNKLLVSWNYDNITSSLDITDKIIVLDTASGYNAVGTNFSYSVTNQKNIIEKEDIKTNKKLHFETLESIDTIQILDEDDPKISYLQKPSSIKLVIENSMYQVMSDDMLSMFATMETLAFKFSEASYKYKYEYDKLIDSKNEYFDKALNAPDLERYMEFYKWLDSSLGSMLDQLKPLSSKDESGLKNTVESHVLERPKFQHKLPLSVRRSNTYTNAVTVLKNVSGSSVQRYGSSGADVFSGSITQVIREDNSKNININYNKAYDYVQTAGKSINNRGSKENDTVFQTRFSAGDGLSELNRDSSGEFSVYNTLNNRAKNVRDAYNTQQAASGNINQGTASVNGDFRDNYFVQRAVPYTSSHYAHTGASGLQFLPDESVMDMRRNDILIDDKSNSYTVYEPPIQFDVPAVHNLRVRGALQDIEVYSPYKSQISTFTPRTLQETGTLAKGFKAYFTGSLEIDPKDTFYNKIQAITGSEIQVKTIEILDNIYPRKDMVGRTEIRTKPNYEEVSGTFNTSSATWSENSYNNNTAEIRSFWRDIKDDRKRTRGDSLSSPSGSINCLGSINTKTLYDTYYYITFTNPTLYPFVYSYSTKSGQEFTSSANLRTYSDIRYNDSVYCLDADVALSASRFLSGGFNPQIEFYDYSLGDLAPFSHNLAFNMLTSSMPFRAKPQFIFNNFPGFTTDPLTGFSFNITFNKSYQSFSDINIKPFYNSYSEFFQDIKPVSNKYSIIPEFAVSNHEEVINGSTNKVSNYLKLYGREQYDSFSSYATDFIVDFPKPPKRNFNKIKFKLSGIKKLLPYNGFYPAQRSVQIVKNFSDGYLSGSITEREKQSAIQPLFAPGILFNTIKAGIAVSFPAYIGDTVVGVSFFADNSDSSKGIGSTEILTNFGSYVVNKFTNKIPFEAILEPETYLFSTDNNYKDYFYYDPTHYNHIFTSGSTLSNAGGIYVNMPSVSISKIRQFIKQNTNTYSLAINNYLSEIPNFFLQDQALTNFISLPESQFNNVSGGVPYEMKISIDKNKNYSSFTKINNSTTLTEEFLYGPPVYTTTASSVVYNSQSYAPYAPPYYLSGTIVSNTATQEIYGRNPSGVITSSVTTVTRSLAYNEIILQYTPTGSGKATVSDIISRIKVLTANDLSSSIGNISLNWAMTLADCLRIDQKVSSPAITKDPITGKVLQSYDDTTNNKWAIQTKFEVPLIDYIDTFSSSSVNVGSISMLRTDSLGSSSSTAGFKYDTVNFQGIWNTYGTIPKDGQSIQLSITDEGLNNSLMKIVGLDPQTKSIGRINNDKIISESIVMIPHINARQASREASRFIYNSTEDKYFFKIDEKIINRLLNVTNYRNLSIKDIKLILDTDTTIDINNSIVDLMIKMVNYNLPPHLNWLYTKLDPFVMYIGTFTHTLSKQDLADVWQGTMPEISMTAQEETLIIEHERNDTELFGNIDLNNYDIKIKTFKIKQRANTDYAQITLNTQDQNNKIPWYSYNWPYDYFSLVELVNVQAGEIYDSSLVSGSV